jgi:CheY-like chemotaxis protein
MAMTSEPMVIVLAEDDEGHASLIERNLKRAGVANEIAHVRDGQEALDYIGRRGAYGERAIDLPLVVLLDINMPRVNGIDVLRQMKTDAATAKIPVIMLTTTDDPIEVERCYRLGCSAYVTKPVPYEGFVETVKRIGNFLGIVRVPGSMA